MGVDVEVDVVIGLVVVVVVVICTRVVVVDVVVEVVDVVVSCNVVDVGSLEVSFIVVADEVSGVEDVVTDAVELQPSIIVNTSITATRTRHLMFMFDSISIDSQKQYQLGNPIMHREDIICKLISITCYLMENVNGIE